MGQAQLSSRQRQTNCVCPNCFVPIVSNCFGPGPAVCLRRLSGRDDKDCSVEWGRPRLGPPNRKQVSQRLFWVVIPGEWPAQAGRRPGTYQPGAARFRGNGSRICARLKAGPPSGMTKCVPFRAVVLPLSSPRCLASRMSPFPQIVRPAMSLPSVPDHADARPGKMRGGVSRIGARAPTIPFITCRIRPAG